MRRFVVSLLIVSLLAPIVRAEEPLAVEISVLECGDFTGTLTPRYLAWCADDTTVGTNYARAAQGSVIQSITIDGVLWQAATWFGPGVSPRLCVAIRKNRGVWKTWIFDNSSGTPNIQLSTIDDAHNTPTIGIDPDHYLWISYDMHGDALKLRKSSATIDAAYAAGALGFSTLQSQLGANENQCSYQKFFRDDVALYFMYRLGGAENGDWYFRKYTTAGGWVAAPGTSTNGLLVDGINDGDSIYGGTASFSHDWDGAGTGRMAFVWSRRQDDGDSDDYKDLSIVFWDGTNFTQADGTAQTVPITDANEEEIVAIGTQNGMSNHMHCEWDDSGRPHVFYAQDASSRKLKHAYWDGDSWEISTVYDSGAAFDGLRDGPGVIRNSDDVAIATFLDCDDDKWYYCVSTSSDYSTWSAPVAMHSSALPSETHFINYDHRLWRDYQLFDCLCPFPDTSDPCLRRGLFAYYKLDDEGDEVHNYDLTNNNSVTFSTGKIGNAGYFNTASSQYLSLGDTIAFSQRDDLTIACWAYFTNKSGNYGIFGKWLPTATGSRSYAGIYQTATDRLLFKASNDGTEQVDVFADNLGSPSTATWYGLIHEHDSGTETRMSANNGTADTATFTGRLRDSTTGFNIGRGTSSTANTSWHGRIDEFGMWNRLLTSTEKAAWYNSGNGITYEQAVEVSPTIYTHASTDTESVAENTTEAAVVAAWGDLDFTHSLTGDDAALFSITDNDDGTATLSFLSAPDYESPTDANTDGVYEVTVTVANDGGNAQTALSVTVADVAESVSAPEITSNGGGPTAAVDAEENQTAVTTVEATGDPTPTYSITGGADSAFFTIDDETGVLTFLAARNYEAPGDSDTDNDYVVEVTATNSEGSDSQTITVSVTNVNEAPTDIDIN